MPGRNPQNAGRKNALRRKHERRLQLERLEDRELLAADLDLLNDGSSLAIAAAAAAPPTAPDLIMVLQGGNQVGSSHQTTLVGDGMLSIPSSNTSVPGYGKPLRYFTNTPALFLSKDATTSSFSVSGEYIEPYDTGSGMLYYYRGSSSFVLKGSSLTNLTSVDRASIYPTGGWYDNGGASIAGLYTDPLTHTIYAFYQADDRTYMPLAEGGIPGTYGRIGLARSTDGGATFNKVLNTANSNINPVLTSNLAKLTAAGSPAFQGLADASVVPDRTGRYLYIFFTDRTPTGNNVCVARADLSKGPPLPGSFYKYYDDGVSQGFTQDGVGGLCTPVVAGAINPQVTYSPPLGQYVMVYNISDATDISQSGPPLVSGTYMRLSTDGVQWSAPRKLFGAHSEPLMDREIAMHPSIIWNDGTGMSEQGTLVYAYSDDWGYTTGENTAHYLVGKQISVNAPPTLTADTPHDTYEDAGVQTMRLTNITAGAYENQQLRIDAVSSDPTIIPNPTVDYTSPNTYGQIQFAPVPNGYGSVTLTVTVRDAGPDGNFGTADDGIYSPAAYHLNVSAVNDAPTLNTALTYTLDPVLEDATSSNGTLIRTLLDRGGQNAITDNYDASPQEGIAISEVDASHGTWEYSITAGVWYPLGAVSTNAARLLAADANTRIRFRPNQDFNGVIGSAITFYAWDQSSSNNGALASLSSVGGTTAFSLQSAQASLTVTAVNDPPVLLAGAVADLALAHDFRVHSLGFSNLLFGVGGSGQAEEGTTLTYEITTIPNAATYGQIQLADGTAVGLGPISLDNLRQLQFAPNPSAVGSAQFAFVVTDDGTPPASLPESLTIFVGNRPTLTAIAPLPSGREDTPFVVTYDALASAANESDPDGDQLAFRVEAILGGTLTKNGASVVPGTTTLGPSESLVWTPPPDVNHLQSAFTVTAFDGRLASITPVEVKVGLTPVNDPPVPGDDWRQTPAGTPLVFPASVLLLNDVGGPPDETAPIQVIAVTALSPVLNLDGSVLTPGTHGTVSLVDGTVRYVPEPNYTGPAIFHYTVRDDGQTDGISNPRQAEGTVHVYVASWAQSRDLPGVRAPDENTFFLREDPSGGPATQMFAYGPPGAAWIQIAGDWDGDGRDTVGLYDPATSTFYLRNEHAGGAADVTFNYGLAGRGWKPIAGDWNGDGRDSVGLYDPATGVFYLKNALAGGAADEAFTFGVGGANWMPLAGQWTESAIDGIGVYDPATSNFYLRSAHSGGPADEIFNFGVGGLGWLPLVGNWDGSATDGVGCYAPDQAMFFLKNQRAGGDADLAFMYGIAGDGWQPLVGQWQTLPSAAAPSSSPAAAGAASSPQAAAPAAAPAPAVSPTLLDAAIASYGTDDGPFDLLSSSTSRDRRRSLRLTT